MLGLLFVAALITFRLVMLTAGIIIRRVVAIVITVTAVGHMQGLGFFPRVPITGAEQKQRGAGGKRAESEEKPLFHGAIR